jgi:hypothetical protein
VKAEHARRAATLFLSLLIIVVVSLGAGTAVSLGAPPPSIPSQTQMSINQNILQQMQQILTVPAVSDLNPDAGLTTGGTAVVITGTGLTGASAVTFGGTPATTYTVDSATQITATAPAHAAGSVQVQVTTSGGASTDTSADDFTYVAAPTTTTAAPTTTVAPTTTTPTTAAPTSTLAPTTVMVTTTVAATEGGNGGLSGGWIAFIVVIALIALIALGAMLYMLRKSGKKGGPAA